MLVRSVACFVPFAHRFAGFCCRLMICSATSIAESPLPDHRRVRDLLFEIVLVGHTHPCGSLLSAPKGNDLRELFFSNLKSLTDSSLLVRKNAPRLHELDEHRQQTHEIGEMTRHEKHFLSKSSRAALRCDTSRRLGLPGTQSRRADSGATFAGECSTPEGSLRQLRVICQFNR